MINAHTRRWLVLLLGLLLPGCPDTSSVADAADRGVLLPDLADDRGPADAVGDRPSDAPDAQVFLDGPPDVGLSVDATPTKATVLYTVTSDVDSFGLRTTSTDGSGSVVPVAGWSGFVDLEPLALTGLDEDPPVNRDRPRVTAEALPQFRGVALPGALGTLYYFHRKLLGTSGLLLVGADGTLKTVLEVPGVYADTLSDELALSQDGTTGAIVQGKNKLLLFRTDATPFGGKSWVQLVAPAGLAQLRPSSLTIAGGWIFAVGQTATGDQLLRAPLAGTGPLSPVALPDSGGAAPTVLDSQLLARGQKLALAGGASSSQRDLYVVDLPSGQATNVTKSPGEVLSAGEHFGQSGGRMALSPGGKLVAFLRMEQGVPELYVAGLDGSNLLQVTSASRFEATVTTIIDLHFADNNNLVFMAGVTLYQLDLFRWDHAGKKAVNVTAHGSTALPFSGYGAFYPRAAWVSPNAKFLYWVEYDYSTEVADLRALDLTTLTLQQNTTSAELVATADSFAACPGSGKLYFVAEPNPKQNNREVWVLDQNSGGQATRLTTMSISPTNFWYVYNLTLATDCSRLAFTAGGSFNLRQLYTLTPQPPASLAKVTLVPTYVDPGMALTPDNATQVFGSGGSSGSATLKAVASVAGATPLTLDSTAGTVHIFAVYY